MICVIIVDRNTSRTARNKARLAMQKRGYSSMFFNIEKLNLIYLRDIVAFNPVKAFCLCCNSGLENLITNGRYKIYKE